MTVIRPYLTNLLLKLNFTAFLACFIIIHDPNFAWTKHYDLTILDYLK